MKTQHTQGEWLLHEVPPNGTYSPPRKRFQISDETDIIGICTVNISATTSNEEAESNAKLIAAAPLLLETLRRFVDPVTNQVFDDMPCLNSADRKAILKAIKKATE